MGINWVTIMTVTDEIDANLKKGFLQQAGIDCIIEANIYRPRSTVPIYNQFKINVPEDKSEDAQKMLEELDK